MNQGFDLKSIGFAELHGEELITVDGGGFVMPAFVMPTTAPTYTQSFNGAGSYNYSSSSVTPSGTSSTTVNYQSTGGNSTFTFTKW